MSKTRNLSDLLDANGDVKSTALDNVPASDDASALTTGTLPDARLSTNVTQNTSTQTLTNKTINASSNTLSNIPNSALTNSSITINGSATSLGGSATINTDLVNDTTPQLGGSLDMNGFNIDGGDDDQILLGASDDLQIFHDGSNSQIRETGTGDLLLKGDANVKIQNSSGTEDKAIFTSDGAVELYHDNTKKFETTSSGATVTGTLTATAFSGDGSALTNVPAGLSLYNIVKITSSGTYTPTSGTKFVKVYCTGGGGGGGGISPDQQAYYGSGGNGGNTSVKHYTATELGANASVSIGSGGSGGSGANNGSTGGGTSFNPAGTGATLTGYGGYGGKGNNGQGGKISLPELAHNNATGNSDYQFFGQIARLGGSSLVEGSTGYRVSGYGGRSFFGRGGGSKLWTGQTNQDGNNAPANSGGGGGGAASYSYATDRSGGTGGSGVVIVEEFA